MPNVETSLVDEILTVAASRQYGRPCWTCANVPLNLRKAMHEARDKGASVSACISWLKKKRGIISASSVGRHFRERHEI